MTRFFSVLAASISLFITCGSIAQTTFNIDSSTAGSQTFDVAGGSVVVSSGVSVLVRVEVWGAGGGGAPSIVTARGARPSSGGGGGGYTRRDTFISAGTYSVTVGAGGLGAGFSTDGGSSNFNGTIIATGGGSNGVGGLGDNVGGSGSAAGSRTGGGGGEGACTSGNGNNASGVSGGSGCDGGDGGDAGTSATSIGGGGGGSTSTRGISSAADGGDGQVRVTIMSFLPVDYIDTHLEAVSSTEVYLRWKTASEINNDRFEIQRSDDGGIFEKIGVVSGSGNINELSTYSYTDYSLNGYSSVCFRLKQIDFDGRVSYRTMGCLDGLNATTTQAYPNPFQDVLFVNYINRGTLDIRICDLQGRVLSSYYFENKGKKEISTLNLRKGAYILVINGVSQQIIKH